MNGLSIIAIVLAVLSSVVTWVDFSTTETITDSKALQFLNSETAEEYAADDVRSLTVVTWDEAQNAAQIFEVALLDGDWRIPSHFNYPADGGERVGETSAAVLNLPCGPLVSADQNMYKELGVLDPMGTHEDSEGVGQRVTVKGDGGKVLVDLIIGGYSEGSNVRFVRRVGDDEVYTAAVQLSVSTAFKDWVETDLLKVGAGSIREVHIQDYSVDEDSGQVQMRAQTAFARMNSAEDWKSEQLPAGKIVSKDKVDGLVNEATGLKLVGVRPYDNAWLQERGFFIAQNSAIYGDEGAMMLVAENGIVYFLYFGEIALGDDDQAKPAAEQADANKEGENRYMVVFTRYDETKDNLLKDLLADQAQASEEKPADQAEDKPEEQAAPRDFAKEIAERRTAMKSESERLQQRFGKFFYVIADKSFKQLRPSQEEIFVDPPKETDDSVDPEAPPKQ